MIFTLRFDHHVLKHDWLKKAMNQATMDRVVTQEHYQQYQTAKMGYGQH